MDTTHQQIVGHFVFDDTAAIRSRGLRPQARAVLNPGVRTETVAFFLAVTFATIALWYFGF